MTERGLDGKVIFITGGARGQGATEARLCHSLGAKVVVTDVLVEQGQAVADEVDGLFVCHDVTSPEQWSGAVDAALDRFGRIDGLVNNAGVFVIKSMMDTTLDEYRNLTEINQTGVFLGMQTVGRVMLDQGSGSMVNISSIAGLGGAGGAAFAYTASKWAVRGMSKSAAIEFGPHGVRVNSVHPGIIETPMLEQFTTLGDSWHQTLRAAIPMGRTAQASEVAELVVFLLSDLSSYCSGHEFVVDGARNA